MDHMLKTVLFDFGGVIAEEGFYHGLRALATENGLDRDEFFRTVEAIIFETGYLIGNADEATYWSEVRKKTGITGSDAALTDEIQKRFVIRPEMISSVERLRSKGFIVAMLSDQTNWLEDLDKKVGFLRYFDRVFNSFRTHKSKRDASLFQDVCAAIGVKPEETLFVDDNIGHIKRAQGQGLKTIHFTGMEEYEKELKELLR